MTALQDQLDEITANTRNLVQPERMAVSERAVAELFASGIEERILPVGAIAPEFTLTTPPAGPSARPICSPSARSSSSSFAAAGAPTASRNSRPGATSTPRLREAGALLAAIGPQTARQSDFMVGQHGLPFPVLTDPGCALAEQFGLAYTIPEYHRDYYRSILVNIPFVNGDNRWRLILPATYVISQAGASSTPRPTPTSASAPSRKRFWLRRWTRWASRSAGVSEKFVA